MAREFFVLRFQILVAVLLKNIIVALLGIAPAALSGTISGTTGCKQAKAMKL